MAGLPEADLDGLYAAAHALASISVQKGLTPPESSKLLLKISSLADRSLKQAEASGNPIACAPRCSWCCHRTVSMSLPEAVDIVDHLRSTKDAESLQTLREKLRSNWQEASTERARNFWSVRKACPMLEDDLCSIYEHRPLRCRSTTSTDAGICRSFAENVDFRLTLSSPNGEQDIAKAISGGIDQALQDGGFSTRPLPLSGILLALLENDGDLIAELSRPPSISWEVRLTPRAGEPVGALYPRDDSLERFKADRNRLMLDDALARLPEHGTRYLLARLSAPLAYRSPEEHDTWIHKFTRAIDAALEEPDFQPSEAYNALPSADILSFGYSGSSMRPPMEKIGKLFHERIASRVAPDLLEELPVRRPGRVRVGIISSNLYHNSGANWVQGWLKNLNKSDFETFAFKLDSREDGFSYLVQDLVEHYHMLRGSPLEGCRFIRSLDIDYLIYTDLADEGLNYQYAVFRLARRQALAWGCPFTSGLPTIDDYLSSDLMEPADGQIEYTEALVRLPNSSVCYERFPQALDPKTRQELGLPGGFLATICQNLNKWLPQHDQMLADIVRCTGNPLLVFRFGKYKIFEERMERLGVPLLWVEMSQPQIFNRIVESCDVSLDPPDWSGGHTSFYTLQFRTPIVTMPSPYLRGRFTSAYLKIAGVPELIADSPEEYVRLATNRELLRECTERMKPDALFEDVSPVRALEEHIRSTC